MRKILLAVLDGMADRPVSELGDLTPLEAAATPNMDALARTGVQGTMSTIAPGVAPESDAAVMSLLGYDVNQYYTGRGPLEACGVGMEVRDGDLAWRVNFAAVDGDRTIVDRRVGRGLADDDAELLAAAVQRDVHLAGASFQFEHAAGHRACLVIRPVSGALTGEVDNGDPAYGRNGSYSVVVAEPGTRPKLITPLREGKAEQLSAELTNDFVEKSFLVLDGHQVNERRRSQGLQPANFLLVRDAGSGLPQLPHFIDCFGANFGALVEMPVERGLAQLTGMTQVRPGPPSGNFERDLGMWARKTEESLRDLDGLYVHIKEPDLAGHEGDYRRKSEILAAFDGSYLGRLGEMVELEALTVCITADHATPCELKAHSADLVPVLISGGVSPDGAGSFGEGNASRGILGTLMGPQLVPTVVNIAQA
jgi:2,3-bisphosphoglycerate-independent phosphoglycerate mutase